jgi:hypothetical protein
VARRGPAPRPTAADRARDAIALALLAGGAALFFYARYRLRVLGANRITRVPGHAAVEQFWFYYKMSYAGLWTAGAGLAAAVAFALLRARRASHPTLES